MTVDQYTARFNALARYAEHIVAHEPRKIKRYVNGLRDELADRLIMQEIDTFEKAVSLAQRGEARMRDKQLSRPLDTSRSRMPSRPTHAGSFRPIPRPMPAQGRGHFGRGQPIDSRATRLQLNGTGGSTVRPVFQGQGGPRCQTCHFFHPIGGRCVTCFYCQEIGHLSRQCPKRDAPLAAHVPPAAPAGPPTKKPRVAGRVYAVTAEEAEDAPGVVQGTLFFFIVFNYSLQFQVHGSGMLRLVIV